jgi:hypothetical protein
LENKKLKHIKLDNLLKYQNISFLLTLLLVINANGVGEPLWIYDFLPTKLMDT